MKKYTEENLNAVLDGEYSASQQVELLSQLQQDEETTTELCKLRTVKQLVKTAYREVPGAEDKPRFSRSRIWPLASAASVVLALAATLMLASQHHGANPGAPVRVAVLDPDGRGQQPAVVEDEETRIVLHLLSPDMQVAEELLDEVEALLAEHRSSGRNLRVEIVAHSEGLALLRQELSTQRARIARLADQYPNLAFVACMNTVERLRVEQGVEVALLPQARITGSGVAHVVARQREGWAYIKV